MSGQPSAEPPRGGWLGALGARLFGRPLAPALVLATLVAVALPAALLGWWVAARATRQAAAPPVARVEAPEVALPPRVAVIPEPELAPAEVARAEEPAHRPEPAPETVATAPPRAAAPQRIASLLPAEPPRYRPDAVLAGGSLEPVRVASLLRGGEQPLPALQALVPEHVGATSEAAPVLYWHLSAESATPVEIAVYSEHEEATPLVDLWFEPPVAAGLHAFRFSEHGLRLAPGVRYHWSAALVPDRERRELDSVAQAALRYAPLAEPVRERLEAAGPARRAHALAEGGYWIDAFALFEGWIAAEPGAANLRAQRAALLEQVGLGALAAQLDAAPRS